MFNYQHSTVYNLKGHDFESNLSHRGAFWWHGTLFEVAKGTRFKLSWTQALSRHRSKSRLDNNPISVAILHNTMVYHSDHSDHGNNYGLLGAVYSDDSGTFRHPTFHIQIQEKLYFVFLYISSMCTYNGFIFENGILVKIDQILVKDIISGISLYKISNRPQSFQVASIHFFALLE